MLDEEWKPIPGYENYFVSNFGKVKRVKRMISVTRLDKHFNREKVFNRTCPEVILKPWEAPEFGRGLVVRLFNDAGNEIQRKVHRLVGAAFLGSPEVTHMSDDKHNNSVSNLRLK